jgi:GTP-binding protein
MTAPLPLEFVQSASDVSQLPPATHEVAVVGRSNVGKSSLINAVANRKKLALVSNTPGRTRLLNLFQLRDAPGTLMDLPGYGYAAASQGERAKWQRMIEGYLLTREGLEMVVVLVDGEVGPTKLDLTMLEWAAGNDLPHTVIATKHDKVKALQRDKRRGEVARKCGLRQDDVLWVSAAKGTGIETLRGRLLGWMSGGPTAPNRSGP